MTARDCREQRSVSYTHLDVYKRQILHMVHNQEVGYLSFADFREKVKDAKFFIRTGEKRPCSNIFMVTSSGAEERVAKYDISFI